MAECDAGTYQGRTGSHSWVLDRKSGGGGNRYGVYLQPLKDIHLQPDIEVGLEICFRPVNDRLYIYIFSLVAFFILIIASINFMNLSTARSAMQGREIGFRKVAGSDRRLLIWQFLTESVIMSLIALAFALIIVELSLPWFNRTMELDLGWSRSPTISCFHLFNWPGMLVGLFSGVYPAFFLSRFKPVEGIKGAFPGPRARLFQEHHGDCPVHHFGGHHRGNPDRFQSAQLYAK